MNLDRYYGRIRHNWVVYALTDVITWVVLKLFFFVTIRCEDKEDWHDVWLQCKNNGAGVILAPKHRHALDPWLVITTTWNRVSWLRKPPYELAKTELFHNRLVAWFINCQGAIPINRQGADGRAIRKAIELLKGGELVMVFPEGTRSPDGVKELEKGIGLFQRKSAATVVPV